MNAGRNDQNPPDEPFEFEAEPGSDPSAAAPEVFVTDLESVEELRADDVTLEDVTDDGLELSLADGAE